MTPVDEITERRLDALVARAEALSVQLAAQLAQLQPIAAGLRRQEPSALKLVSAGDGEEA